MAYADENRAVRRRMSEQSIALAKEWRKLGRAATFVAVLTSPALFALLSHTLGWGFVASLLGTIIGVVAFRGLIDVISHKLIPAPSLYGAEEELAEEDIVSRRRLWFWRRKFRTLAWLVGLGLALLIGIMTFNTISGGDNSVSGAFATIGKLIGQFVPMAL